MEDASAPWHYIRFTHPPGRIAEAEREGRLGEIEGLQVSLAGALAAVGPDQADVPVHVPRPGQQAGGRFAVAHVRGGHGFRHCSVRFASPSYLEALSSCAYNGKITPAGNLFDPHVP